MYFSDVVTTGTQWGGESLEFKPLWGMGWGTHDWPSEFQESHRLGPSISIIWKRDHQIKRRLEAGRRRIIPWCSSHPGGLCNAPWDPLFFRINNWMPCKVDLFWESATREAKCFGSSHLHDESNWIDSECNGTRFFSKNPVVAYVTCNHNQYSYHIFNRSTCSNEQSQVAW
jgi:hypothetical protein